MGNFISLTPWSDLFHSYQHKKRKMVQKGVNPSLWRKHNLGAAIMELGHVTGYKVIMNMNTQMCPHQQGKLKYKIN